MKLRKIKTPRVGRVKMGKETPIVLGLVTEGNYMGCENKLDYPVIDRIVQKVYKRG